MKKLILIISLFFAAFLTANAQNDTVCAGSTTKYKVADPVAVRFTWTVQGTTTADTTILDANADSISVRWTNTAGIDTIKVVGINIMGCPGDTVTLAVVRLKPSVAISGTDSICINSATTLSKLKMTCTSVGPWTVNYTVDGVADSVIVSSSPYNFNSKVFTTSGTKQYTITGAKDSHGCTATFSGNANVAVFPKPTTSPISRY